MKRSVKTTSRRAPAPRRAPSIVALSALITLVFASPSHAQGVRLFRDGAGGTFWDFSYASQSGASTVEMINGSKAPLEYTTKWRGTTAIRLNFKQQSGGDWVLGVATAGWAAVNGTPLDSLVLWSYSATAIPSASLPYVFIEDVNNVRTPRYSMASYNPSGVPAATWTRLVMPLAPIKAGPGGANMTVINKMFFCQAPTGAMNVQRTISLDEIRWIRADLTPPVTPTGAQGLAFERHVDLLWDLPAPADVESHRIERLTNGVWTQWTWGAAEDGGISLWAGSPAVACTVRAIAEDWSFRESSPTATFVLATRSLGDTEFMDMIQRATFRYFWQGAHPVSGLIRERSSSGDVCTSGGTGFGLMTIPVGIERGYVTRAQGTARVLQVLTFLSATAEKHWGAFPHWIHGVTGQHVGFLGPTDDTVDLVETSYVAQGLLTVRQYFDGASADETQIRTLATQMWEAIEWNMFVGSGESVLRWHRSPTTGLSSANVQGWNECLITYLLAIASPTHPVPAAFYTIGWARNGAMALNQSYYGYPLYVGYAYGGPMFFAHYSFLGLDPRFKHDAYANYYTHNRDHALVQVAYSAANPLGRVGYSSTCWGLTASDDPYGYSAHEAMTNDNGTLTPTAALASMPYVPQQSMAAARTFYDTYGATLWGFDGFKDAFHPGLGWTASDYLAIDQGPIVLMIENFRSGLLWKRFMANSEIAPMLAAVGFVADSSAITSVPGAVAARTLRLAVAPNPSAGAMVWALELPEAADVSAEVFDLSGRRVAVVQRGRLAAGRQALDWSGRAEDGRALAPGVYLARVQAGARSSTTRFVRMN
jgi:hypothetical protein